MKKMFIMNKRIVYARKKEREEERKKNLICNMTLRRTTLISNQIIETN